MSYGVSPIGGIINFSPFVPYEFTYPIIFLFNFSRFCYIDYNFFTRKSFNEHGLCSSLIPGRLLPAF